MMKKSGVPVVKGNECMEERWSTPCQALNSSFWCGCFYPKIQVRFLIYVQFRRYNDRDGGLHGFLCMQELFLACC